MFDPVPAQQLMYTQPREQRPVLAKVERQAFNLGDVDGNDRAADVPVPPSRYCWPENHKGR